ncbi:hypothetical protein HDU76_004097 [Blyttiomyces sp. JEL0837]|nr:hypothetical protein HDU76_004097 [Blyttiomyces sp. JEL0837]
MGNYLDTTRGPPSDHLPKTGRENYWAKASCPIGEEGRIYDISGGVPFVLDLILKNLKQSGALINAGDHTLLNKDLVGLVVNDNPGALIYPQYDSVSAAFREVIGLASVLGTSFNIFDLEYLVKCGRTDQMSGTSAKEVSNVIQRDDVYGFLVTNDRVTYTFRSGFVQEGIYQLILKNNRDRFHLQILERIEHQIDETVLHSDVMGFTFIETVLYWNYHVNKVDSREVEPHKYARYKSMLLEIFYERQMVSDAIEVFEQLEEFWIIHPTVSSELDRAKFNVMVADFYGDFTNQKKVWKCLDAAIFHLTRWRFPTSTFGKIWYIVKHLMKVKTYIAELKKVDITKLTLAENFDPRMTTGDDFLICALNLRAKHSFLKSDIMEILMGTFFGLSKFGTTIFEHPMTNLTVVLALSYDLLTNLGAGDVTRNIVFKAIEFAASLEPDAMSSLSLLNFFMWIDSVTQAFGLFEEGYRYSNRVMVMAQDLQITSVVINVVACDRYFRDSLYIQGRFAEMRSRIEDCVYGTTYFNHTRHVDFAQEIACQSEMMNLFEAHAKYKTMQQIKTTSGEINQILYRDLVMYMFLFRYADIEHRLQMQDGKVSIVGQKTRNQLETASEEFRRAALEMAKIVSKVQYGPGIRSMLMYRLSSFWLIRYFECDIKTRSAMQEFRPYKQHAFIAKIWQSKLCFSLCKAYCKAAMKWLNLHNCTLHDAVKPLIEGLEALLVRKLDVAISKWEMSVNMLVELGQLEYFVLLVQSRISIIRLIKTKLNQISIGKKKQGMKVVDSNHNDGNTDIDADVLRTKIRSYGAMSSLEFHLSKSFEPFELELGCN